MDNERITDNGHEPAAEEESQEQLNTVYKNLKDLVRPDGSVVTMGKQELSLMKQMLLTGTDEFKDLIFFRLCDFIDDDEAYDHVTAYYEAKDLGMDTGPNVALMFALVSTNRHVTHTNLMSMMLDTVQYRAHAPQQQRKGRTDGINPRSPLAGNN